MFWKIACGASIFVTATQFTAALAQESQILESMRSGGLASESLVVIPEPTDASEQIPGLSSATDQNSMYNITPAAEANITDRAFPLMSSRWPFNTIFVCWETTDPQFADERKAVRDSIQDTWEAHSGLRFLGWGQCASNAAGIRIKVADEGPHVKQLGKYLNGVPSGMVLNFTYKNWSPNCQNNPNYCTRLIAVHEFGHAIGFAHEQNRPDTPGECTDPPQGRSGDTLLTPWDPNSVMNYCNEQSSNGGALSTFDILAVQYIYGLPQ